MYFQSNTAHHLVGTSFYSSESDSDTDYETMASSLKRNQCASNVHKKIKSFFTNNPIPEETFKSSVTVFDAMFALPKADWAKYTAAKNAFLPTATLADRVEQATAIGECACNIRVKAGQAMSVITTSFPTVTIQGLEAGDIEALNELITVLHKKMIVGGTVKQSTGDPAAVIQQFKEDMELAKDVGMIPPKYYKPHKIWAMFQHAQQKGIELAFAEVAGNDAYNKIVQNVNNLKEDARASTEGATLNMANKFAVDAFAVVIAHYKDNVAEKDQSLADVKEILRKVAGFTRMSSVGTTAWANFVKANVKHTGFLNGLTDGNMLYDNPGKLTKARLIACSGCLYVSNDIAAIFGAADHTKAVPKLISEIFILEKENGEILDTVNSTSNSEHALHLLLCLGERFNYSYNRNKIPHSVRQTKFNILN